MRISLLFLITELLAVEIFEDDYDYSENNLEVDDQPEYHDYFIPVEPPDVKQYFDDYEVEGFDYNDKPKPPPKTTPKATPAKKAPPKTTPKSKPTPKAPAPKAKQAPKTPAPKGKSAPKASTTKKPAQTQQQFDLPYKMEINTDAKKGEECELNHLKQLIII